MSEFPQVLTTKVVLSDKVANHTMYQYSDTYMYVPMYVPRLNPDRAPTTRIGGASTMAFRNKGRGRGSRGTPYDRPEREEPAEADACKVFVGNLSFDTSWKARLRMSA